jgi:hypothetical protein
MKITVLPIKRFALMQSDVFIDVIKNIVYKIKRMAPTSAKLYEKNFGLALGAYYLQTY